MNPAELIAKYVDGPQQLRKAVQGMSPEQLRAKPVPGKWSTLEVICHLVDFDPIIADRMKRVIAEDQPTLIGADEKKFAERLSYHARDHQEELTILETTRRQMARILRTLKPDDFARTGMHNERGQLTLEQLLTSAINHIPHHVKFVEEKRRALGLPV
jgi:uncharacterized damage-inducible protein DinB